MVHLTNIAKHFGDRALFKDASFQIREGDRIGLVGPNGSGKTSLFRMIMGMEVPDSGSIATARDTVLGYFSQDIGEMKGRSALEEVKAGAGRVSSLGEELEILEAKLSQEMSDDEMTKVIERYGEVQAEFQHRGGYDLDARAKANLTGLGIGPGDYDRPVEYFSGGWKMRIALASILTLNPDVLLMDEPTNHLDLESIIWLEEWLSAFKGALIMTSHDREFMNRSVNRIVEIANSAITVYSGNYEFYLTERTVRREQLLASYRRQQEMLAKEEEFIARFAARASHAAQVQSRVKKLDKIDRIEIPAESKTIQFTFDIPPRSGNDVVKMEHLSKSWPLPEGASKSVFGNVTGMVRRLDKIAVTGVNGAGKSTFLKVILGLTEPSAGHVGLGANVRVGYFSQHSLETLNEKNTVIEEITNALPNLKIGNIRSLLGAFLFSDDDVNKKISVLSGGEKSRVVLAIILASQANLLVLDEPTNHLDIESREILLKAIENFEGTVLVVSHDRHFLRAIAHRVFEISHGELQVFEGNYDYYLSKKPHS